MVTNAKCHARRLGGMVGDLSLFADDRKYDNADFKLATLPSRRLSWK